MSCFTWSGTSSQSIGNIRRSTPSCVCVCVKQFVVPRWNYYVCANRPSCASRSCRILPVPYRGLTEFRIPNSNPCYQLFEWCKNRSIFGSLSLGYMRLSRSQIRYRNTKLISCSIKFFVAVWALSIHYWCNRSASLIITGLKRYVNICLLLSKFLIYCLSISMGVDAPWMALCWPTVDF